jgi:hypothetical protein
VLDGVEGGCHLSTVRQPVKGRSLEGTADVADRASGRVDIVEIEEVCAHAEQFGGMCTSCGKDMTV